MEKLTPKELELLGECNGKHASMQEILACESCSVLLKDGKCEFCGLPQSGSISDRCACD